MGGLNTTPPSSRPYVPPHYRSKNGCYRNDLIVYTHRSKEDADKKYTPRPISSRQRRVGTAFGETLGELRGTKASIDDWPAHPDFRFLDF